MPWPKGRPRSPETLAKMPEAARRGHAGMSDEAKAIGAATRSAAMKALRAEDTEHNRQWRKKCAASVNRARESMSPESRRRAVTTLAVSHAAERARLTDEQVAEYWVFRGKRLRHAEAMSLVETGRMS